MTTRTAVSRRGGVPVADLTARSREIRPADVAARTAAGIGVGIGSVFIAAGWVFGGIWRGIVFCCVCAAWGFRSGAGLTQPDEKAKTKPET